MRGLDRREIYDRLAGLDPDAQPERRVRRGGPQSAGVRRAERAERVVSMRDGCPEERVHRVADVLLDDAALGDDAGAHLGKRSVERALQPFRTEPHGEVSRSNDVDEDAGHEAALFPCFGHGGKYQAHLHRLSETFRPHRARAAELRTRGHWLR